MPPEPHSGRGSKYEPRLAWSRAPFLTYRLAQNASGRPSGPLLPSFIRAIRAIRGPQRLHGDHESHESHEFGKEGFGEASWRENERERKKEKGERKKRRAEREAPTWGRRAMPPEPHSGRGSKYEPRLAWSRAPFLTYRLAQNASGRPSGPLLPSFIRAIRAIRGPQRLHGDHESHESHEFGKGGCGEASWQDNERERKKEKGKRKKRRAEREAPT
jgi:hypothetical protein